MVLATIISGGGATPQQDGWHACGPECCFGALTSGDVELLEYSYPIIIHRYSLMTDSGGAGKFRGGSGTAWEVEPLDSEMLCIGFGEGRRIPAMGAAGAKSKMIDDKVGRIEVKRGGKVEVDPHEHDRNDQARRDDHQHEPRRRGLWQSASNGRSRRS